MVSKVANQWCKTVLPTDFEYVVKHTAAIQKFLKKQLPEPISQKVRVINLTDDAIVIAVTDSQIANYLRLYSAEIQQQIQETFDINQTIKIKTMPDAVLQTNDTRITAKKPSKVAPEVIKTIQLSADLIENEDLKLAMKSLASSLDHQHITKIS